MGNSVGTTTVLETVPPVRPRLWINVRRRQTLPARGSKSGSNGASMPTMRRFRRVRHVNATRLLRNYGRFDSGVSTNSTLPGRCSRPAQSPRRAKRPAASNRDRANTHHGSALFRTSAPSPAGERTAEPAAIQANRRQYPAKRQRAQRSSGDRRSSGCARSAST